jgi:hypothetical protein
VATESLFSGRDYSRGKPRPLEFAALPEEPTWACYCADQPRCCEIEGACCFGCNNERDYRETAWDGGEEDDDEGF